MGMPNRLELQRHADEIEKLVGDEDVDLAFRSGRVRVAVSAGPQAELHDAFMKKLGVYIRARKFPTSDAHETNAREVFLKALEDYVAKAKM